MLTSEQTEQLHRAILKTFDESSLKQLIYFKLNKDLDTISASTGNFSGVVFDVIRAAQRENWAEDLIGGLQEVRPSEAIFSSFAEIGGEETINSVQSTSGDNSPVHRERNWLGWIQAIASIISVLVLVFVFQHLMGNGNNEDSPLSPTAAPDVRDDVESPTLTLGIGSIREDEKTGVRQVYVPAGSFLAGSTKEEMKSASDACQERYGRINPCWRDDNNEKLSHSIYVDAFWIDETEIDQGQYTQFVEDTTGRIYGGDLFQLNFPAHQLSWEDANAFCQWRGARLPTELEWEKAARWNEATGESFIFPWGNEFGGSKLNYCDKNCEFDDLADSVDDGFRRTAPVRNYSDGASPYGALNMAGNVSEWVDDQYSDTDKISRGGYWGSNQYNVRSAFRIGVNAIDGRMGGRCVQDAE